MVRWVDASRARRAPPPNVGVSAADLCAACWTPRDTRWTPREIGTLPAPVMWARCAACAAVTWYADVPAAMLAALGKKPPTPA
ncbi:MAG: hypothetical protein ABIR79_24175 [Candidatus Binatia bacterium]